MEVLVRPSCRIRPYRLGPPRRRLRGVLGVRRNSVYTPKTPGVLIRTTFTCHAAFGGCGLRPHSRRGDDTTTRRHDVPKRSRLRRSHEDHEAHKATQRKPCESLRRIAAADRAALRAVAGVRDGQPQTGQAMNAGLWLAIPHSCQRRPQADVAVSGESRSYSAPTLWLFVLFVALGVMRRRRNNETSCRRLVAPSCKREAQPWARSQRDSERHSTRITGYYLSSTSGPLKCRCSMMNASCPPADSHTFAPRRRPA